MAIVQATKTVSHSSPYTGRTFQQLTARLLGRDGYLSGGATTDDNTDVSIELFAFAQRGIIAELLDDVVVPIPAALLDAGVLIEPAFVIAAVPDDSLTSGVVVTVTGSLEAAASSVIIAFKAGGAWQNPVPVDMTGPRMRAVELGIEDGLVARTTVAGGDVTEIKLQRGQLVDPDGVRRRLAPLVGSTADAFELEPLRPDDTLPRTDYIVRRRVDDNLAEIRHLMGSLRGGGSSTALQTSSSVCRPHFYAKRGGTIEEQWWAWSQGVPANVRIQGGPAGEAFAATTLLTAGGGVFATWIVGQRASDDAVILLYSDTDAGGKFFLTSFDPATGALVDAAVQIDSGAVTFFRAAQVAGDQFHLVYQKSNEIYYGKVSLAAATFGTFAVASRLIEGVAEGQLSSFPDVAADRYGRGHVCWVTGVTGSDNSLKYVIVGVNGTNETEVEEFLPADSAATTSDSVLLTPAAGADGYAATAFDSYYNSHIVVTDHDEVYVAMLGESTAGSPIIDHVLLFNPTFRALHGFPILSVASSDGIFELGLTVSAYPLRSVDITAGELGQLLIVAIAASGTTTRHLLFTLNTEPFRNGLFEDRTLVFSENALSVTDTGSFADILIERGQTGGVELLSRSGSGGSIVARTLPRGGLGIPQIELHPKDVALLQWEVGADSGGALVGEDGVFAIQYPRPKKMNYPFLVGDRGDYRGHESIRRALAAAAQLGGGHVVVRPGVHHIETSLTNLLTIPSGVSLLGENNAFLYFASGIGLWAVGGESTAGASLVDNVVSYPAALFTQYKTIPQVGDLIDLAGGGSGLHTILAVLTPSGSDYRFFLSDNINGTPVLGALTLHHAVGLKIENLTIRADLSAAFHGHLLLGQQFQASLRGLRIEGAATAAATGAAVQLANCPGLTVDGVDFAGFDADPAVFNLRVRGGTLSWGDGSIVRGVRLTDGKGVLRVSNDAHNVHLIDCGGDGTDPTEITFNIQTGRSTPVYLVNCQGRIDGDAAYLVTNVGQTVRVPEDGGALAFEDDNTRAAAGISDDRIKLSGVAPNDEFNGATTDVIVGAVNERVLLAGDEMTGPLEFRSADFHAWVGLQMEVDDAGFLTRHGAHFIDDFMRDPTDANSGWVDDDAGAGVSSWVSPHILRLDAGDGTLVGRGTRYHAHAVIGTWANKPIWRARLAITNGATAGHRHQFGIVEVSSGPVAYFFQDFTVHGLASVQVVGNTTANVTTTVDTGFTPTNGTFYWYWLVWRSTSQFYWKITADLTSAPIADGTVTLGAGGLMNTDPGGLFFNSQVVTAPTIGCLMDVDVVEFQTSSR